MGDQQAARKLRALLESRLDKAVSRSLEQGEGGPSDDEIDSLVRLSKLCELADSSSRRTVPHWQLLGVLAAILVLVTVFFFVEVPSTSISGNAVVSTVTFRLSGKSALSKGWASLPSAAISHARSLQVPPLGSEVNGSAVSDGFVLLEELPGKSQSDITIAPVTAPGGAMMTLEAAGLGNYRVQLRAEPPVAAGLTVQLNAKGPVRVKGLDRPMQDYELPGVASFIATSDDSLTFEFTISPKSSVAFQPLLRVNLLEFDDVEVAEQGRDQQVRVRSMIRTGSLFLEALGGREHKLREAEELKFTGFEGVVRSLTLQDGAIVVNFEGDVRGASAHGRSLKPSLLEFLRAQKPVELLWGTALGLFGGVLAVLRWFKLEA